MSKKGDWMRTFTGKNFYPHDPHPEDIVIEDIAHALSMMCRFNGHCNQFYSVAEHCILISDNVSKHNALWGLLHDASEAYISDIVRPAKNSMPEYKRVEHNITVAVCKKFGLSLEMPEEVKLVDLLINGDEAEQLLPHPWDRALPKLGVEIKALSPAKAKQEFLDRFNKLFPSSSAGSSI